MSVNTIGGNTLLDTGAFPPCRVATTGAITLSGLQTIDGIALIAGDRVLVWQQGTSAQNGIYAASTGAWQRTSDARSNAQFYQGMTVPIAKGATYAQAVFQCTSSDDPVIIGTSALTFGLQLQFLGLTNPNLFPTRALAIAAIIPSAITVISVAGYAAIGDTPGLLTYKKVGGSTTGGFQSADGAWWQLVTRPLNVCMFGGIANGANQVAAFQAAYDCAADGETVQIPPGAGTWVVSSAVTFAGAKRVTWKQLDGALISTASLVNVTGMTYAAKAGAGEYWWNPGDAPYTGRYWCFQDRVTGAAFNSGQDDAILLLARNTQPLSAEANGVVGFDMRGYIATGNTNGYCFATNTYALIEAGGDGVAVGNETDVWNEGSLVADPFSGKVKFGQSIVNQGPNVVTAALLIAYGAGVKGFYNGITIAGAAIDHLSPTSVAFEFQDLFTLFENGDITIGKPGKGDLTIAGIDFIAATGGARFSAPAGQPHQLYQARAGNLAAADNIGQILHYGKNGSGTGKSFATINSKVLNSVAGTEQCAWEIGGIYLGSLATFMTIDGVSVYAPDNSHNLGGAGARWKEVFAVTGTINTSDADDKHWRGDPEEAVFAAALDIEQGLYQFKDAVGSKGDAAARLHYGTTAQRVRDAFAKRGLDAGRFALFCADPITARVKKTRKAMRQKTELINVPTPQVVIENGTAVRRMVDVPTERGLFTEHLVFDEAGLPVMEDYPHLDHLDGDIEEPPLRVKRSRQQRQVVHREPVMEEVDEEYFVTEPVLNPDGSQKIRYGLRYDQLDRLIAEARHRKAMEIAAAAQPGKPAQG